MQWKKMQESTMQERTTDALRKNPKTVALEFANALESTTSLLTSEEGNLPSIVTVAVTVPRESLRFLSSTSLDKVGTPGLHLVVYNGQLFENSFSSLYLHFGKLSVNPDEKTANLDEDPLGWSGISDLVVTCPMPAFQFLVGQNSDTRVALVNNSTPASSQFAAVLGPHLRIYDASIKACNNFLILPNTPAAVVALDTAKNVTNRYCEHARPKVQATIVNNRLRYLSVREDLSCSTNRQLLLEGAFVETSQQSPCSMAMKPGP